MINKKGLNILLGVLIGAFIAALMETYTPPIVWFIIVLVLSLLLLIKWEE